MNEKPDIYYQPGPQAEFGACSANIAIYGGAAGGGKSRAAIMEPLHHLDNPLFKTVIFRRTTTQIRNPGGLWDESRKIYPLVNGESHESFMTWRFPSGATVKFAGLEHDASVLDFQGAQIPLIIFDELTMFSEYQFWFMMSRNRSESGVPGYIRATCNPDVDSWVRKFIDWWIGKDGLPMKSRAGKIRWMVRQNDEIEWFDSRADVVKRFGKESEVTPKSVTFIPARLSDNRILMENDPEYKATLEAMPQVERERLLNGNWNIRPQAGDYFRREWFEVVDVPPPGWAMAIRAWDRAATRPGPANPNPDWTRGILLLAYLDGTYCVADLKSIQDTPGNVKKFMKQTAAMDGPNVRIRAYEDPGSAGKMEAEDLIRSFQGYDIECLRVSEKKHVRAKPVSSQAGSNQPGYGGIKVVRGEWNEAFFRELSNFCEDDTKYDHDDICLVGETMISTLWGPKRLDQIKPNEIVWTPLGLKKVLLAEQTGLVPTHKNGPMEGTANHPVFQHKKGFVPLDTFDMAYLNYFTWKSLTRWTLLKSWYLTENPMASWEGKESITFLDQIPIGEEKNLKAFMWLCGNFSAEKKFRRVFMFTIGTATHLITNFLTLSVYHLRTIIGLFDMGKRLLNILRKSGPWQPFGTVLKKAGLGIKNMLYQWSSKLNILPASIAEKRISINSKALCTVLPNAPRPTLKTTGKFQENADIAVNSFKPKEPALISSTNTIVPVLVPTVKKVYNLKIQDASCYYANGILVGNCDALSLAYYFGKFNTQAFSDEAVDNFEQFMRTGKF